MTTLEWILIVLVILLLIILIPCIIMILIFGDALDSIMPKFKQKRGNKYSKPMKFGRFIVNITILDYVWKPFFKVMKYNKPIGKIYNIFIGSFFINFIIKQRRKESKV